jgi:hypothetical protein
VELVSLWVRREYAPLDIGETLKEVVSENVIACIPYAVVTHEEVRRARKRARARRNAKQQRIV